MAEWSDVFTLCGISVSILLVLIPQAYIWYQYSDPSTRQEEVKKRNARFVTICCICLLGICTLVFLLFMFSAQNDEADDPTESESLITEELSESQEVTRRYRGGIYYGTINSVTDAPDKRGTMRYDNGNTYEGEWINGIREGSGRMVYSNGDVYEGEWKNDKRHGQGTYTWKDGGEYTGEYKEDMRDGEGIYTGWTGYCRDYGWTGTYRGTSKEDMFEGYGSFEFDNGDYFQGTFSQNRIWTGEYIRKDGSRYSIVEGIEKD